MIAIKQALIDVKHTETMTIHRRNEGEAADNDDQLSSPTICDNYYNYYRSAARIRVV